MKNLAVKACHCHLGSAVNEMVGTANWSFSMYPGLSEGAIRTLEHHGTDEQNKIFVKTRQR